MEEHDLTTGQFRILLNATAEPQTRHTGPAASLVTALHKAHNTGGHKWRVKLSGQDIETALDLFITHQESARTPGAQQALQFFVGASPTAQRILQDRKEQADVPRETSEQV